MAGTPDFAATPKIGAAAVSVANTGRDGTGTIVTVFTAGTSGSIVEEIDVKADGHTAACTVVIFLYDGTTYYVFDEFTITDVTASTTLASFRAAQTYSNLVLPSGWSIRASITVAPTSGTVKVIAFGGDF